MDYTLEAAAEIAEVTPARLLFWLETGKFKTSRTTKYDGIGWTNYHFSEADIARLVEFAEQQRDSKRPVTEIPFIDDGKREFFTVAQVASLWELSSDTIQRLFENESGVLMLGEQNPRGKRKRVTLRIPRAVMERVKKRRSNPA